MMKKIVVLFFLISLCLQMQAEPAWPVRKVVKTVDGKELVVALKGDENFSYYETDDGIRLRELKSGICQPFSEFEFINEANKAKAKQTTSNARRVSSRRSSEGIIGKHTGLVILANFSDVKFTTGTKEIFNDFFNKHGYSGFEHNGSVHDYFYDQSYGKFDVDFDVVGPVTLPHDMEYYGGAEYNDDGVVIHHDKNTQAFAQDAVIAAANIGVDYSKYDWDDDDEVDQVFIIYAGYAESNGGPSSSIWPHEYFIGNAGIRYNGKLINTYGCASELIGSSGNNLCGIGTPCHEFSHCLGLRDVYDTGNAGNLGMGKWDVMGSGNHLENGRFPMAYTAYERWVSGWVDPVVIDKEMTVTGMRRLEDAPDAYIMYNEGNSNEYYMLENRYNPKWGRTIEAHGLLVTHIDYDPIAWYYNSINAVENHERMTVIPADNMRTTNFAGDPYPGERKNHALTDESTPAATLFNKNCDGTYFMSKPLEDIQESTDGLISFKAMTGVVFGPKNLVAEEVSDTSFRLSWDEVENAESYEVSITEIAAPNQNPYESVIIEENFAESCYKASVSDLNNDAGKLDSYCVTKGWTGTNLFRGPKGLQVGTKSKKGTLMTPTLESPYYGKTTVRLTASPAVTGEKVTTYINLYIGGTYYGKYSLNITNEHTFTLDVPETHSTIAFEIAPDKRLFVSYMAVYDGDFSADDFDKYGDSSSNAKAITITTADTKTTAEDSAGADDAAIITSTTTSIVYDKVNQGASYISRVRAKLANGSYSKWSAAVDYVTAAAGIKEVNSDMTRTTSDKTFNLSGQQVSGSYKGVVIKNGRKYICK